MLATMENALVVSNSVWPSDGLLLTTSLPMIEPAPGLFSTIKGLPRLRESSSPSERAITSVPPPARNGTITRTGRAGYDSARAPMDKTDNAATSTTCSKLPNGLILCMILV